MNGTSPRRNRGVGTPHVAFVLSGGASLGAVQVGMLRALFERDIRPDILVGTSVGAVNAAYVGARPEPEAIDDLADIWRSLKRQHVFPIDPFAGAAGLLGRSNHLIPNAGLRGILERHMPLRKLEEAALPVNVVATDLKSGRAAILRAGAVIPALLASCAIPGVYPPVTIGRRQYIDGGVANHTPMTVALELGATEIYVLPVGYPWLNREPTNAVGMALYALTRIIEQKLISDIEQNRHRAGLHVLPQLDLCDISPADFGRTDELIDWGYKAARRYLGSGSILRAEPAAAA